ncbi:MAG: Rpn family recombination-promoting nuclease/putative transposase [Cyanothece sp. SIO2G6]|nr:Rpn family recombination-promoting nuclease/putative transposase [Cyanothece sp. SIO2G6]
MVFLFKERYINLLTDFGFKRVFGTEANKQFTIDFLNTLLPQHHQIRDLSFKNNENLGLSPLDRRAIFDIFCEGINGDQFIVEMQRTRQGFFKDRSLFYATFPIQEQSTRGDWDYRLPMVYTISVLNFIIDPKKPSANWIHRVMLKDDAGSLFYDKLAFIYIELPKFDKVIDQLTTREDKWLFLFRYLPELTDRPQPIDEPIFDDLFAMAEIANFSSEEQDVYQATLKAYRDFNNVMNTAIQEAEVKGIEKGAERERSLILRLLVQQVGSLPEGILAQVQQLTLDDLEVLADTLLDFNQLEDLTQWLYEPRSP